MICYYCYFLGLNYKYELKVCNGYDDISMMTIVSRFKGKVVKKNKDVIENKEVLKKIQNINTETCQKKKKKQEENMEEINIET